MFRRSFWDFFELGCLLLLLVFTVFVGLIYWGVIVVDFSSSGNGESVREFFNGTVINLSGVNSYDDIVFGCSNLSLSVSVRCIRDYLRVFYVYNVTDDNVSLSFDDLLVRGGDCRDWSFLVANLSNSLGFVGDTFRIVGDGFAHRFAVISDSGGWCVFSGLSFTCFDFVEEEGFSV